MAEKKTLEDVRAALFKTLEALQDPINPMDIERAKAVNEVSQTIINSAKVEVDYMKATGKPASGFIPSAPDEKPKLSDSTGNTFVHRIQG